MFVLRAEIVTIFGSKDENATIFSKLYNISQPNFAILLILISSLREFTFFCLDKKLV
jgi:hypothetical protein